MKTRKLDLCKCGAYDETHLHSLKTGECFPRKQPTPAATHTPTPWKTTESIHDFKEGALWRIAIFADKAESGDKLPAEAMGSDRATAQANAAFIVKAVNCHGELLKAAHRAVNALAANGAPFCEAAKELRAAITKAEGGK